VPLFDFFDKNKTAKFKFQKPTKGQARASGSTLAKTLKGALRYARGASLRTLISVPTQRVSAPM
jgi:hypothetical protein